MVNDVLEGPRPIVNSFFIEVWHKGPAAQARIRALRQVLGQTVTTRTKKRTQRVSSELGADRVKIEVVEIEYADPRGKAPALPSGEQEERAGA